MNAIQEAISNLTGAGALEDDLALRVAGEILAGEATPAQIGAFLTGLRIRGEEPRHLLAFARTMRAHAAPLEIDDRSALVDTCGTGGDHSGTFNISTTAAIIAAGAGAKVAKHGNRAVTGRCGSADVLKALGVKIDMTPATASRCLREAGIAFLFAPSFHGAMKHAAAPRREIGIRTIFNMLGPLANPAGAERQLIGVYDRRLTRVFAEVLSQLGSRHVMIVHGSDGLDEITLTGPTEIAEARDGGEPRSYSIEPEQFGMKRATAAELAGGDDQESAALIRGILSGEAGPRADIAVLNAGAALAVAGKAGTIEDGIAQARGAVKRGDAMRALERLVQISNDGAGAGA